MLAKLALYHLSHTFSPFCIGYFGDGILQSICAWTGLKLWSYWFQPPKWLGLHVWAPVPSLYCLDYVDVRLKWKIRPSHLIADNWKSRKITCQQKGRLHWLPGDGADVPGVGRWAAPLETEMQSWTVAVQSQTPLWPGVLSSWPWPGTPLPDPYLLIWFGEASVSHLNFSHLLLFHDVYRDSQQYLHST
jgi:hypothetical protein